jgi:hypothetical protein
MAVQRVAPASENSPPGYQYPPAARQQSVAVPRREMTVAEQLEDFADDYQRAMFCRKEAERARRQWFAGRQREIAHVVAMARAGDPRFRTMSSAQVEMTARWRWSQSAKGQYLMNLESKFTGWAEMYLSFAEVEVLNQRRVPPG